jgi:hypothetical protein
MKRACLRPNTNTNEQNASSIRPLKINFIRMKHILFALGISSVFIFNNCTEDSGVEYTNNPPEVTLSNKTINSSPGSEILIEASLKDDFGLKYVSLSSAGIYLDRIVDISTKDTIISEYDFSYNHMIPLSVTGKEYFVSMKVKNLTGQVSVEKITLVLE